MTNSDRKLQEFLDIQVDRFNDTSFIALDPISIPHKFTKKQDIEIAAFWTAILSWGRRNTIINKATELFSLMGNSPYDFIMNHEEKDLQKMVAFKHRTFLSDDTLYFIDFLRFHYEHHDSLEDGFLIQGKFNNIESSLNHFRKYFFSRSTHLRRTEKHISAPFKKSTCKRLNMFLRWMVRQDMKGVDFGVWKRIDPGSLMIPFDVHVDRIGRQLGLITRKQRDWQTVVELSDQLRKFDPKDPIKYDFALFGMGVLEN